MITNEEILINKRTYYRENRERIRKIQKEYYDTNKDKLKLKKRSYYKDNRLKIISRVCEYSKKNKKKINKKNRKRRKEWGKMHPDLAYEKMRKKLLKRFYNLTPESYEELFAKQGNKCAICGKLRDNKSRFCVDHDHTTKKVRGILCDLCNRGLGQFKDNIINLESAKQYLIEAHERELRLKRDPKLSIAP